MTYHSLRQFYAGRPDRAGSLEADYGVMWRWGAAWPLWRVSYIRGTGELYAIRQTAPSPVDVLAIIPPDPDHRFEPDGPGISGPSYYETVDNILTGWADVSGMEIRWLITRLTGDPRATMHYPRRGLDRRDTVWACCESGIGAPCRHGGAG